MPRARAPRCATPSAIGRVVGAAIPDIEVLQVAGNKIRLAELDEPFAELLLIDDGALVTVRFSCHCAPGWAGRVVALLFQVCDDVRPLEAPFIQAHDGRYLYDQAAADYWKWYVGKRTLLTARFNTTSDGG